MSKSWFDTKAVAKIDQKVKNVTPYNLIELNNFLWVHLLSFWAATEILRDWVGLNPVDGDNYTDTIIKTM